MADDLTTEAVWRAIGEHEGPAADGSYLCTNTTLVDATGLSAQQVAAALERLWRRGQIEGVLVVGGVSPFLRGIRRVLPGRSPVWGADGQYLPHPP